MYILHYLYVKTSVNSWTKTRRKGNIVSNIYRTICTDADIWHTDALTISPLTSWHTLVLRTSPRGVHPKRSPLLLLVAICWESFVFIVQCLSCITVLQRKSSIFFYAIIVFGIKSLTKSYFFTLRQGYIDGESDFSSTQYSSNRTYAFRGLQTCDKVIGQLQ